jgi:ankyrin repeat protein
MQMLLDNGADIHSKGGLYGTVLQAALSQDNPDTLKILNLLIKLGVDINQKGGMYNTAIEAAIQGGSEANRDLIVRTLIRQGADVNTCGNLFDGNPLQAAAFRTQSSCVRILLEHGAKFNAEGYGSFDIEVQEAAYQQDESLLRSRLATSKRSSHRHAIYYSTLLEVSKEFGYVAVADLILKNGGVNLERVKNHQRCKFLIDRI